MECSNRKLYSQRDENEDNGMLGNYDLTALRQQTSAVSPLVVAPMMMSQPTNESLPLLERIVSDYIAVCKFYGCETNAGVFTTLRFSLPCLRVEAFQDSDMLALAEVFLKYGNGPLSYISRLDFRLRRGQSGFGSHGALVLSKILQHSKHIQDVFLPRHKIGSYGASAIFIACTSNEIVQKLNLRRCAVGERGALAFAELCCSSSECGLLDVDLSANHIGLKGSIAIEKALKERDKDLPILTINLEGNLVFQEIMNGVTHGLGILLAMAGAAILTLRVQDQSERHVLSCAVYSTSLVVLYTSSTLYHSFFTLQHTKYIFEVCDKCAIYILIAGSYTPFLQIIVRDQPLWSTGLLALIWFCCALGISVEAFCPDWKHRTSFSLVMYLGMGWSAIMCLPDMVERLPRDCLHLMVLGGVSYTVGVPFFIRNYHLDHALWHVFVLVGSIFHWFGVYWYVARYPEGMPNLE